MTRSSTTRPKDQTPDELSGTCHHLGSINSQNGNMYLSITENVIKIYQMLILEQTMLMIDVTTLDVTDSRESEAKPKLHTNGAELH